MWEKECKKMDLDVGRKQEKMETQKISVKMFGTSYTTLVQFEGRARYINLNKVHKIK